MPGVAFALLYRRSSGGLRKFVVQPGQQCGRQAQGGRKCGMRAGKAQRATDGKILERIIRVRRGSACVELDEYVPAALG